MPDSEGRQLAGVAISYGTPKRVALIVPCAEDFLQTETPSGIVSFCMSMGPGAARELGQSLVAAAAKAEREEIDALP